LLPPSLREWLPANHLAWFVIDAVESMDLAAFDAIYRTDGHGRPAHEPSMMVALLLYCYAIGERSSRRIESGSARSAETHRCRESSACSCHGEPKPRRVGDRPW
jgi:transposase